MGPGAIPMQSARDSARLKQQGQENCGSDCVPVSTAGTPTKKCPHPLVFEASTCSLDWPWTPAKAANSDFLHEIGAAERAWMLQTKQRKIQILRISTYLSRDKYQVLFCVLAKTRNCDDQTMRDRLIELSHGRAMD